SGSSADLASSAAANAAAMERLARGEVGVDDFELLKVLGKGSFGKVFLVRLIHTGELYAMKVLKKKEVVRRRQVEHTKAERRIMGGIDHPFIVSLRFAFQSADKLYMVTDYCRGGELFFHFKKFRTFPEHMVRFFTAELVAALGHLHGLDIVYRYVARASASACAQAREHARTHHACALRTVGRQARCVRVGARLRAYVGVDACSDLKPENVLLDEEGHIHITDFGLSKDEVSDPRGATTFCGTPEYLAPEMLTNRKSREGYGKSVDWWSLGTSRCHRHGLLRRGCRHRRRVRMRAHACARAPRAGTLVYEMLTGWPPFYDKNLRKMCEQILKSELAFPATCTASAEARDFIRGLLQRDPAT
ncbi:hypothetical protein EON62_06160, partial [archaeon]